MINMLKSWKGAVEVNGTKYNSINDVKLDDLDTINIKLLASEEKRVIQSNTQREDVHKFVRVEVKQWMCKPATPQFDLMDKINPEAGPMPLQIMEGEILSETAKMYKMKLHGMKVDKGCTVVRCCKCGKTLTNKISKYFGIGPECSGNYFGMDVNSIDIEEAQDKMNEKLVNITWTGNVIKSAIKEMEDI